MQCICNNNNYYCTCTFINTCAHFFDTTVRLSTKMEPTLNTFNVQEFSSSELADRRERRNRKRSERDRARRASETTAQREERLRKRRLRDRARRAAESEQHREARHTIRCLSQSEHESDEQREARLRPTAHAQYI